MPQEGLVNADCTVASGTPCFETKQPHLLPRLVTGQCSPYLSWPDDVLSALPAYRAAVSPCSVATPRDHRRGSHSGKPLRSTIQPTNNRGKIQVAAAHSRAHAPSGWTSPVVPMHLPNGMPSFEMDDAPFHPHLIDLSCLDGCYNQSGRSSPSHTRFLVDQSRRTWSITRCQWVVAPAALRRRL